MQNITQGMDHSIIIEAFLIDISEARGSFLLTTSFEGTLAGLAGSPEPS